MAIVGIYVTPWKINMEHNSLEEVDGRSFSFLNGWFEGSTLIFQGVSIFSISGAPVGILQVLGWFGDRLRSEKNSGEATLIG